MGLKAALDQLATWSITGITNLGLDDLKGAPAEADLPCVVPRVSGTGGEVLSPLGISQDQGRFVAHVDHLLLVSGLGMGLESEREYEALAHVDNYLAAVADDLDLGGTLLEALSIADSHAGAEMFYGTVYYAVVFRLRLVLQVT